MYANFRISLILMIRWIDIVIIARDIIVKPIEHAARFDGNAFIVFSMDEFPHLTSEKEETVELRFKTTNSSGVSEIDLYE